MAKTARRARTQADEALDLNRILVKARRAVEGEGVRSVTANLAESPLGWLMRRRMIGAAQFEAGERLRADFMMAGLGPSVTMRWTPAPPSRTRRGAPEASDPTAAQLAAKRRFEGAVAAAGPGLSDVLWRVVCLGEGLETAEAALGWPARAGKLVLILALDRVDAFYKLG